MISDLQSMSAQDMKTITLYSVFCIIYVVHADIKMTLNLQHTVQPYSACSLHLLNLTSGLHNTVHRIFLSVTICKVCILLLNSELPGHLSEVYPDF